MTEEPKLHDLTKFLLARRDNYPEEFWGKLGGRWDKYIDTVWKHGGEADRRALGFRPDHRAMKNALRSALQELLAPEEEAPRTRAMKTPMQMTQEVRAILNKEFAKAMKP